MKRFVAVFLIAAAALLVSPGCKTSVDNSITFRNLSAGDLIINFRGELLTVPVGTSLTVREIDKGTYDYNTTYAVPPGITSAKAEGAVEGELSLKAGTKIMILYTSFIVETSYTLYATISSSEDKSTGGDPLFP